MPARPLLRATLVLAAAVSLSACDSGASDTTYLKLTGTVTPALPPLRVGLPVMLRVTGSTPRPLGAGTLTVVAGRNADGSRDTLFTADMAFVQEGQAFSSDVTVLIPDGRVSEETTGSAVVMIEGIGGLGSRVQIFPRR